MTRRAAAVAIAMAMTGCESVPGQAVTRCDNTTVVARPVKTDILFVVDDSGSMSQVQQNLIANFGAFIQRLAASPIQNDYQIGITTTSIDWTIDEGGGRYTVYTRDPTDPNAPPYPAGALVAKPGKPKILVGSSPTLAVDFVANAVVGSSGSTKEQGLRAATLAVTDRIADGQNAGFLRPDARLAVIIISDEDDCSDTATPPAVLYPQTSGQPSASWGDACHSDAEQARLPPVSHFVDSLKGRPLGGEAREIVVAIVAGVDAGTGQPKQPVCSPSRGYPAYRYKAFANAFGTGGLAADVCQDFGATLTAVAGLIDPGQTVTVDQPPPDGRLLVVSVARANAAAGATTSCKLALDGTPEAATADVVYLGPQQGRPATLTFQNGCKLQQGDTVQMRLLCAS